MIRQHIIEHHKLGLHKIARTQVAPQNLREEFHRLLSNGRPQPLLLRRVAEGLVNRRINLHPIHRIDIQPLRHERLHKLLRLGIPHHAIDLRGEHLRLEQFTGIRQLPQRRVGHAAPEEIRQPRRQLMCVQRTHLVIGRFHQIQEIRRHQRHHQHLAQGILEGWEIRPQFPVEPHEAIHLHIRHRPAPGPRQKARHHLPRIPRLIRLALIRLKENPPMLRRRPLLKYRPFKLQPIHAQLRILFPLLVALLFSALD